MKSCIPRTPFYFLRHAETDHNVNQIYDDENEIHINNKGVQQAFAVQAVLDSLHINTVCSSPLLRVQQTKTIALKNKAFIDVILEDLRECPSALWRLFLASESRALSVNEWEPIQIFINRVKQGLEQALRHSGPQLLIAHGGTYWAISHLLSLNGDRKIDNCVLAEIFPEHQDSWNVKFLH